MAQLNPNFEIDFNDINSYEQIQLINDTQLAKENLLMHRAYKEPSDDEIIKNHFSSFTFVDFCPKVFKTTSACLTPSSASASSFSAQASPNQRLHEPAAPDTADSSAQAGLASRQMSFRNYELETFSDLFERINSWLKLNKDWRVVSVETLVHDFKSQFNHLKSSIHASCLPQSTRGVRLFLSPSKSRFSGAQKIGCINVVPRKLSGSHSESIDADQEPVVYEDLDQALKRLNELLLTRPIEGRILSVETLTLPIVNGYVNTECNYFLDSRLNLLFERTYNLSTVASADAATPPALAGPQLVDILRVYYEFGPAVCGLVNLLDFVPRFYSPVRPAEAEGSFSGAGNSHQEHQDPQARSSKPLQAADKIAATESTTRLIRRSLTWFEAERKRVLAESKTQARAQALNLKLCNVQLRHKVLLKSQLLCMNSANALDRVQTRQMAHEPAHNRAPIVCAHCRTSTASVPAQDWCSHLVELSQPYQLKFVRLAYVIPVTSKHMRSIRIARPLRSSRSGSRLDDLADAHRQRLGASSASLEPPADEPEPSSTNLDEQASNYSCSSASADSDSSRASSPPVESGADELSQQHEAAEALRQAVLGVVHRTIERHRLHEQAHQALQISDHIYSAPIGQLTYRLFAPCQLVKSSSCFSINPVNSSSPLSRRGSVNINGTGLSSDSASASSLLLGANQACHQQSQLGSAAQSEMAALGAFFPALPHEQIYSDVLAKDKTNRQLDEAHLSSRFTSNEFEPVEAIRRRMEVYVTTNSMKVIAGETLVVNLSDALSCLSTSIEQTVVRTAFGCAGRPSSWVSVYILYAAVDEPLLPAHLLAQQRIRDLNFDQRAGTGSPELLDKQTIDSIFEDNFKSSFEGANPSTNGAQRSSRSDKSSGAATGPIRLVGAGQHRGRRDKSKEKLEAPTAYNSAYDRTVALPTQPDNNSPGLEMFDLAGLQQADCLWPF